MEVVGPSAIVAYEPPRDFLPLLLLLLGVAALLLAAFAWTLPLRQKGQRNVLYKDVVLPSGISVRVPVQ